MLSCGHTSPKVDLLTRYVKFFLSLRKSASKEVQLLSRYLGGHVQYVTGRNLMLIQDIVNLSPWNISNTKLKEALISAETVEVPMVDRWRLPYLSTLLF